MLFKPKRTTLDGAIPNLKLGDKNIEQVRCTKFLGIYLDDKLEWSEHIDHVAKRVSSGSYAIRMAKRLLSQDNLKSLYFSLVHSHLSYGNIVWGTAYQYRLHKLMILQKKCVRNVCHAPYNHESAPLFKQLNVLRLEDILKLQLGKFMYSYVNGLLPQSLQTLFTTNASVHEHNTRHRSSAHIVATNNSSIARTFVHEGPKMWLSLPLNIRNSMSKNSFNFKIKKHLINQY